MELNALMLMLQPVAPKAGSPVAAPPQQTQTSQPAPAGTEHQQQSPPPMGLLGSPLFLMLLFLPFIFLMWRRNKKENEARSKLKKGDKVVAGGLVGEVIDIDDRTAKVKIAPGVNVQVLSHALSPFEDTSKAAESVKDAKAKAEKAKGAESK